MPLKSQCFLIDGRHTGENISRTIRHKMSVKQKSLICHVDCFTNRNIIKTQHFPISYFHFFRIWLAPILSARVCMFFSLLHLLLLLLNSISFCCRMLLMNANRSICALCFNLFNRQFNRLH